MTYSARNQQAQPLQVPHMPDEMDLGFAFGTDPEPIEFILPGMPLRTVGALVAQGGAGKSWCALEMAVAVAGGPDLLGMGIECKGRVLYLPAEDPSFVLHERLRALSRELSAEQLEIVKQNLKIRPLMNKQIDLLHNPLWLDEIKRAAEGAKLIIIDTLRRFHSGDENDGREMTVFLGVLESLCDDVGASLLYLHHTNKGASLNGNGGEQQASRGSSVLVDNIRGGQFNLLGMTEVEAKKFGVSSENRRGYVRLTHAKCNFKQAMPDRWLCRSADGVLLQASFNEQSEKSTTTNKKDRGHG